MLCKLRKERHWATFTCAYNLLHFSSTKIILKSAIGIKYIILYDIIEQNLNYEP